MWMHSCGATMQASRAQASTVQIWAPAKLNLFLEVLGKRPDGYHDIETLMAPVDLCDWLEVSASSNRHSRRSASRETAAQPPGLVFSAQWAEEAWGSQRGGPTSSVLPPIPQGADNLVVKALELLRRRAGTDAGATIRLVKRIPVGAGLGGGSSDAAAALVAGSAAWGLRYSARELTPLAAELGSDVPFFLAHERGHPRAAICRGRGECVEPIEPRAAWHFVIVQPPEGLATADVYRQCRPAPTPRTPGRLVEALHRGELFAAGRLFHNTLQAAASQLSPWIRQLKEDFDWLSLPGHQMSGSGASYFGLCLHAGHARRAAARLRSRGWNNVYVVRGYL